MTGKILVATVDTLAADGEQMLGDARRATFLYLGIFLAVLIAVILLSRQVLHTLRELLGELAGAVDKMRDGHYDVAIPHTERTDEIGIMARATEGFRDNFMRVKEQETAEKHARDAAERKVLLEKIAGDFEAVVGGIVGAVSSASGELSSTATTLTKTAGHDPAALHHGGGGLGRGLHQRPVGRVGDRGDGRLDHRDRPPGAGVRATSPSQAVDQAAQDRRPHHQAVAGGEPHRRRDPADHRRSPSRPTCWRSTPPSRRRAPARPAGALPWWRRRSSSSPRRPPRRPSEISGADCRHAGRDRGELVAAIKEIGTTIGRISEIAGSVAAAVEEQGAATQEISNNIQQSARGTAEVATDITEVNRRAGDHRFGLLAGAGVGATRSLRRAIRSKARSPNSWILSAPPERGPSGSLSGRGRRAPSPAAGVPRLIMLNQLAL